MTVRGAEALSVFGEALSLATGIQLQNAVWRVGERGLLFGRGSSRWPLPSPGWAGEARQAAADHPMIRSSGISSVATRAAI
jgi:hypothetical protein